MSWLDGVGVAPVDLFTSEIVSEAMKTFCSFCRQSSDFSSIVSLDGLEFTDHHGEITLVTKVISKILPELTVNFKDPKSKVFSENKILFRFRTIFLRRYARSV